VRLPVPVHPDSTEVEDVAQETFIKAYRALPSFRGDSAFYTWLYRIGINTAKNYLVALGGASDHDRIRFGGRGRIRGGEQLRDITRPRAC